MKFGYFDDANKEYVITSPKTPLPWINYLGSENFFSLISNTCGGYSFYKDAKLLRLTRYLITMFLSTAMDTTTILKRAIPSGIPDGCQPRPIWTLMSVITVWATPPSGAVKMICRQSWPHLFRLERTVRSISWLLPITVKRRKIFLFFLM